MGARFPALLTLAMGVLSFSAVAEPTNNFYQANNGGQQDRLDLAASIPIRPDQTGGAQPFGSIEVTFSGTISEPNTGCTLHTEKINFDFGEANRSGTSQPATIQITCGEGNAGETIFRLSTSDKPSSTYRVTIYDDDDPASAGNPDRQTEISIIDAITGQEISTQTFAINNSGSQEQINLQAKMGASNFGGRPIPAGSLNPNAPDPVMLHIYL